MTSPNGNGKGAAEKVVFEKGVHEKDDAESDIDEEVGAVRESDYKRKQTFKGWTLLWLAYQSTGVIYGDIGTSPLYVYSSTFTSPPEKADLLGALSLIIWSLTLIVTVKYVFIVLSASDEGEGGTFAMYNLLSRYSDITNRDPRSLTTVKMERYHTNDLRRTNRSVRSFIERSPAAHIVLKIVAVFGVSLIMADGILTPAQSVLGAIQGLSVVKSDISSGTVVGVSCAILVLLFAVQPLGITKLTITFAPIVVVWLLFNAVSGIFNLVQHDASVLKAFSPFYAGDWFVRNGTEGWKSLGGILLAFTGVEALFADLGAFSKRAVQLSWLVLAYPCLLLAYIGQAAYISRDPTAYSNPFFNTVPPGTFYFSLVIAILAAIVASQALITSTFQLLTQVMNTSYFPHINVVYTSEKFHGQMYIPIANWLMMIGTVIVTAVYSNTTRLGQAYGVCVILVTFITTCLVSVVALIVWRMHWAIVLPVWFVFATLDGLYLTSALTKVPDGAWFTILLAAILGSVFVLWRYGKEKQWAAEGRGRGELASLVVKNEAGGWKLAGGRDLTTIKGIAIFFDKGGDGVPAVYEEFLKKFEALPEIQVFFHMRALSRPHASEEERFAVARTALPNCYRLIVRYGYNDIVVTPDLGEVVYAELKRYLASSASGTASSSDAESVHPTEAGQAQPRVTFRGAPTLEVPAETGGDRAAKRLATLEAAYAAQVVYIVGKEQLRLMVGRNGWAKRLVLEVFLWIRENTRAKVASMRIPVEKLVEVGFVREL
ncbi:potassium uptake protein [Trichodelitschia bisporula]|uniref:Potassium uptake protein n=1 Tax=Trichodelitschia bisporula TaxID=703511 RepID=A0A6G1HHK2_9PEZI|nr:potassium uptake protein [Trichodelitschia bisporula]